MEENNSILSDIDGLNEHNLGQDDSNNYEDIEETEALVALSNAENSEGLVSVQQFSTQTPLETVHEPAFESEQTIFLKPQNAISSQSSFYEFESPIEGSFENDCKSFLLFNVLTIPFFNKILYCETLGFQFYLFSIH